ncbi:hypothetical protein D3C77_414970 [compost metagenome]
MAACPASDTARKDRKAMPSMAYVISAGLNDLRSRLASTLYPATARQDKSKRIIPVMLDQSMRLPFMIKMNRTPLTDRPIDNFCRSVVVSFKNRNASSIVKTGVKANRMPPSLDAAYFKP